MRPALIARQGATRRRRALSGGATSLVLLWSTEWAVTCGQHLGARLRKFLFARVGPHTRGIHGDKEARRPARPQPTLRASFRDALRRTSAPRSSSTQSSRPFRDRGHETVVTVFVWDSKSSRSVVEVRPDAVDVVNGALDQVLLQLSLNPIQICRRDIP